MHQPERWGMLQFSTDAPNQTEPLYNVEWPVRVVAMAVYDAEHAYAEQHEGTFTDDLASLCPFVKDPQLLQGVCTKTPMLTVDAAKTQFKVVVTSADDGMTASVDKDRLLQVQHHNSYHKGWEADHTVYMTT